MKTIYLFVLLMSVISTLTSAQLLVGPEVGMNYSWTATKDEDFKDRFRMKPVIGFHVGGHLAFKVRKRFFLHSSLVYSTKGRSVYGEYDGLLKNVSRHNYIDMPINYTVDFKGKIGDGKEFKYFFGIGPNISYWLGGKGSLYNSELEENNLGELKYKIKFKSIDSGQDENEMRVERANRFQLGLNVVAGVIFEPWYKQRIMFSVHYELGHSYIAKSDGTFASLYYTDSFKARNQGFRIALSYLYDLKTEERKKGKSTLDKRKLHKG